MHTVAYHTALKKEKDSLGTMVFNFEGIIPRKIRGCHNRMKTIYYHSSGVFKTIKIHRNRK